MPTATAAVLSETHAPFVLEEIEVGQPRRGEVLVRIVATGLCHTDLSAREGLIPFPLPGVLGHEGAGVVEAVGDGVSDLEAGDHVVLSFAFCGSCPTCRGGHPVYCGAWPGLSLFGGARADGTATCIATANRCTGTSSASRRSPPSRWRRPPASETRSAIVSRGRRMHDDFGRVRLRSPQLRRRSHSAPQRRCAPHGLCDLSIGQAAAVATGHGLGLFAREAHAPTTKAESRL